MRVIHKAITTCEIDDYVLSDQSKINDVRELDEKLNNIFNMIVNHKEVLDMDDAVCLYRQKGHRLVHEYFLTSTSETPVSPEAFGTIMLKCLESLQAGEKLESTISDIMLFYRLQSNVPSYHDDSKKTLRNKI